MGTRASVINLRCDVCGTEIVVSASGDYKWHPIYCCGLEIHAEEERSSGHPSSAKRTTKAKAARAGLRKKTPSRKTVKVPGARKVSQTSSVKKVTARKKAVTKKRR